MRHASLFSGIGGPEIAAAMMGWENVFHCEINPFGRLILEYWFPNSDSYDDITKTDFRQYRGTIDVLTGGFPCQPFSYAGKRKGQADDRYLWPEMLRVIDEIRPTWVIGENVAGIATMVESGETTYVENETPILEENRGVHRYESRHTFTIERICQDLEKIGYSVQPMLIPACAVGAPHRRDRVFIIARIIAGPDCGNGLREPGEHESEGGKERLPKWHEIRKPRKSDNLRSKFQSSSSHSHDHSRRAREAERTGQEGISRREEGGSIFSRTARLGASRTSSDSIRRDFAGCCGAHGEGLRPEERWRNFPTVSPVHRGNDGFPFDVDNLTISFAKWRNESLKAYGNAIVPQVMYRIFQCIDALSL